MESDSESSSRSIPCRREDLQIARVLTFRRCGVVNQLFNLAVPYGRTSARAAPKSLAPKSRRRSAREKNCRVNVGGSVGLNLTSSHTSGGERFLGGRCHGYRIPMSPRDCSRDVCHAHTHHPLSLAPLSVDAPRSRRSL